MLLTVVDCCCGHCGVDIGGVCGVGVVAAVVTVYGVTVVVVICYCVVGYAVAVIVDDDGFGGVTVAANIYVDVVVGVDTVGVCVDIVGAVGVVGTTCHTTVRSNITIINIVYNNINVNTSTYNNTHIDNTMTNHNIITTHIHPARYTLMCFRCHLRCRCRCDCICSVTLSWYDMMLLLYCCDDTVHVYAFLLACGYCHPACYHCC